MESKVFWKSKTSWMSLVVAVSGFIPGVGEYVSKHPETVLMVLGFVFQGLRMVTKGKVTIEQFNIGAGVVRWGTAGRFVFDSFGPLGVRKTLYDKGHACYLSARQLPLPTQL